MHVTLAAEHGTAPGSQLGELLPLSAGLVARIDAWNERWSAAEGRLGDGEARWLDEGAELARWIQQEADAAGQDVQVIYLHDRSRNPRQGAQGGRPRSWGDWRDAQRG